MPLATSHNRNTLAVSNFSQITDSVWGIQGSFQFVYMKLFCQTCMEFGFPMQFHEVEMYGLFMVSVPVRLHWYITNYSALIVELQWSSLSCCCLALLHSGCRTSSLLRLLQFLLAWSCRLPKSLSE